MVTNLILTRSIEMDSGTGVLPPWCMVQLSAIPITVPIIVSVSCGERLAVINALGAAISS